MSGASVFLVDYRLNRRHRFLWSACSIYHASHDHILTHGFEMAYQYEEVSVVVVVGVPFISGEYVGSRLFCRRIKSDCSPDICRSTRSHIEAGDDAIVGACKLEGPEEIWVEICISLRDGSVREHNFVVEDAIYTKSRRFRFKWIATWRW